MKPGIQGAMKAQDKGTPKQVKPLSYHQLSQLDVSSTAWLM
jgi:hypothetical protein